MSSASTAVERFGLGISNCRKAPQVVASIREAESLGAEMAFVAEDINCRDAFQLCALGAKETQHIRLATGVVNPYTRNPTALAMAIATLDEISHGRAVLGLGASTPALIEGQMGIPMGDSVSAMREAVTVIRALLIGENVTMRGTRFTYAGAALDVLPLQPRVPIFLAAMGPRMLRLAGALADGVLLNVGASTEYVRWAVAKIREGAVGAGRSPHEVTVAAWLTTYITEDREAGLQRAREWLATMLSIPRQGELLLQHAGFDLEILPDIRRHVGAYPHVGDRKAGGECVPTEVAEKLTLIGDQATVRDRIQEYRAAGVDLPVLGPAALRDIVGSPSGA